MKILKDIDPKDEAERNDHVRNAIRLHVPTTPITKLTLEVFGPDGSPISVYRDYSRSWVRNLYNLLATTALAVDASSLGTTYQAGSFPVKDTGGTTRTSTQYTHSIGQGSGHSTGIGWNAAAGVVTHGVVVGTDATAEAFDDYVLGALVANGSGAGQLDYAATTVADPTYTAGTKTFDLEIVRLINNNSTGTIGIKEVGLIYRGNWISTTITHSCLVSRDVLAATVDVVTLAQLKVTYTISMTFPA